MELGSFKSGVGRVGIPDVHNAMPFLPVVRNKMFLHPHCVRTKWVLLVGGCQTVEFTTAFSEAPSPELCAIPVAGSWIGKSYWWRFPFL